MIWTKPMTIKILSAVDPEVCELDCCTSTSGALAISAIPCFVLSLTLIGLELKLSNLIG